jgi:hypothetical protein
VCSGDDSTTLVGSAWPCTLLAALVTWIVPVTGAFVVSTAGSSEATSA